MARILLIDDSEIARELIQYNLEDLEHDVVGAGSGEEGLRLLTEAQYGRGTFFEVVITDLSMPGISGTDVLANVQKICPETPVILLSSNSEVQMVRQALRAGAFDYVIKDEGTDPLQAAILRALEEAQARRGAPREAEAPVERLREWVGKASDGEFIATSAAWEIHVHLQAGRVAWATSSASRYAFTRHLIEHFGIEKESISAVVQECHKTRKNVGETLVEWGVATLEQVRESLKAQIVEALSALPSGIEVQTIFLARSTSYAQNLTFELDELLA